MHPVSQSALTDTSAVSMIAQESAVRVFPYKLVNSARGLQSFYRQSLYIHWKLLAKSDSHSAENSANFDVLYYYRYTLKGLNGILLARADPSFNHRYQIHLVFNRGYAMKELQCQFLTESETVAH